MKDGIENKEHYPLFKEFFHSGTGENIPFFDYFSHCHDVGNDCPNFSQRFFFSSNFHPSSVKRESRKKCKSIIPVYCWDCLMRVNMKKNY